MCEQFEYKGMKTVGDTIQAFWTEKCLSSTPAKM